jgi:hypothetical protein
MANALRRYATPADWRKYNESVERGEVPSGNWCKCCERYDCGCDEAMRADRDDDGTQSSAQT